MTGRIVLADLFPVEGEFLAHDGRVTIARPGPTTNHTEEKREQ